MPRVIFAVTCDDVREEVSNKVSLMGIFDRFIVGDFRNPLPSFYLFAKIEFEEEGDYPMLIQMRTIEGEVVFQIQGAMHVDGVPEAAGLPRGNFKLRFDNLRLPRHGLYELVVSHNNQNLISLPISVQVRPARFVQ